MDHSKRIDKLAPMNEVCNIAIIMDDIITDINNKNNSILLTKMGFKATVTIKTPNFKISNIKFYK